MLKLPPFGFCGLAPSSPASGPPSTKGRGLLLFTYLYYVNNKNDLINKIIPFFEKNELQTIKQQSYLRFKKALDICLHNKFLSLNNVEELKILKSNKSLRGDNEDL